MEQAVSRIKKLRSLYHLVIICAVKFLVTLYLASVDRGARCSSMVRAFAHCAMGRWINPSWGGPIELFLLPASAPRLV